MKLALGLALLAMALVLMCLSIRWVFFLGLGLAGVSGALLSLPLSKLSRFRRFIALSGQLVALLFILWLSSFGREPLAWSTALVIMFAVGTTEIETWRARRKATYGA